MTADQAGRHPEGDQHVQELQAESERHHGSS
jgi:hypothetical protein